MAFEGWVVSDWGAQHGTVAFALGGLDQEQEARAMTGGPLPSLATTSPAPVLQWVENATYYGPLLAAAGAEGAGATLGRDSVRSARPPP